MRISQIKLETLFKGYCTLATSFLLALFITSVFFPIVPSSALTCTSGSISDPGSTSATIGDPCASSGTTVSVNIENPYFISVSSSHGSAATPSPILLDYTAEDSPNLGSVIAASDTVVTTTNTGRAHYLYISTTSDNTTTKSNNLVSNNTDLSINKTYIAPGGGDSLSSASALSANTWGFALPNTTSGLPANSFDASYDTSSLSLSSKFTKVPALGNDLLIQQETSEESTADIYYGALATVDLYANTYSNTIKYTAFSESPLSIPTMQEFTAAECSKLPTATAENYNTARIELRDSRDNKIYTVAKMADGHCWMSQNLALDGLTSSGNPRTLTPEDSNVTTNYTFPNDVQQINDGTTISINTNAQIYTNSQNTEDSYGSKYGNYYNFFAATAGEGTETFTGTATQSVCPKGWRLPDNAGDWSYANLMGSYDLPTSNIDDASAVAKVQQAPLHFPLAGRYYSGIYNQGVYGEHWSRTVYSSSDKAYNLNFYASTNYFNPQDYNVNKYGGLSVRCVFGGQADDTMQTFTTEMCNSLAESTATADHRKTLIDARDGKFYKISKLADGNCWMVSNLALDGMDGLGAARTLTTTDTNINTTEVSGGSVTFDAATIQKINDDTTGSSYNTPQIYTNSQNITQTNADGEKMPYGNYYNWTAATATVGKQATTGAVYSSICPKGWRLPDNGTATGLKSYSNLVVNYTTNVDGTGNKLSPTNVANAAMVARIQRAPLYFPLAGNYYSGASNQGVYARYWSRIAYSGDSNYAYGFGARTNDNNQFYPQDNFFKPSANPVRCVLGE